MIYVVSDARLGFGAWRWPQMNTLNPDAVLGIHGISNARNWKQLIGVLSFKITRFRCDLRSFKSKALEKLHFGSLGFKV